MGGMSRRAIMDYSAELSNSILQKICNEMKELAKWMETWDSMISKQDTKRIKERGQDGQCRQSNHVGVCHSWDPTVPKSRPRFKEEGRRAAAQFYGAIMDWAESKGKGLGFWRSGENTRFTVILRAIRAIWKKERCQMDMLFDSEKNLETTYYMPISLLTYMKERFPVLMWADMFWTSPTSMARRRSFWPLSFVCEVIQALGKTLRMQLRTRVKGWP